MDRIARTYPAPSTNRYYQRHKYCGPSNLHPVNAPRFISSSAAPALLPAALLYAPASARADVCHSQHTQAQALSAHTHTHKQTQVAIHTRTLAVGKIRRLSVKRTNEARSARARRSAASGLRSLPPARRTTCDQLFVLKSSTDKGEMIALPRGAQTWRSDGNRLASRCGSVRPVPSVH